MKYNDLHGRLWRSVLRPFALGLIALWLLATAILTLVLIIKLITPTVVFIAFLAVMTWIAGLVVEEGMKGASND